MRACLVACVTRIVLLSLAEANVNMTILSSVGISEFHGGFNVTLFGNFPRFGSAVAKIGDVDGDQIVDLAVGVPYRAGSIKDGSVFILYMTAAGTVKSTEEKAMPYTSDGDGVGSSLASLAIKDGGYVDLIIGAPLDEKELWSINDFGAIWTVWAGQKKRFRSGENGVPNMTSYDRFGSSVAAFDVDSDGLRDLVIGAPGRDGNAVTNSGALWVLFSVDPANNNSNPTFVQEISAIEGNFGGTLKQNDLFGTSVCSMDDLDGDLIPDLAVGASGDSDGAGVDTGAVWILFLNMNGTVKGQQKISSLFGNFNGALARGDKFGASVTKIADLDGDGIPELAVGATGVDYDDTNSTDVGALWILFLNRDGTVKFERQVSGIQEVGTSDTFGNAAAFLDYDESTGILRLCVGAFGYDNGRGSLFIVSFKVTVDSSPIVVTSATVTSTTALEPPPASTTTAGSRSAFSSSLGTMGTTAEVSSLFGSGSTIGSTGIGDLTGISASMTATSAFVPASPFSSLSASSPSVTSAVNSNSDFVLLFPVTSALVLLLCIVGSLLFFKRHRARKTGRIMRSLSEEEMTRAVGPDDPTYSTMARPPDTPAYGAVPALALSVGHQYAGFQMVNAPRASPGSTKYYRRSKAAGATIVDKSGEIIMPHMLQWGAELGRGEYGVVFDGLLHGEQRVAIKVMTDLNAESLMALEEEAAVMQQLPPNSSVLGLIGVCYKPYSIVAEFAANGALREWLHAQSAAAKQVGQITLLGLSLGTARGVAHLHEHGIVHRDLATRNILLTADLTPKVADFGLARVLDSRSTAHTTKSNTGPLRWMAPEAISYRQYSTMTDVWAFGMTMVEIYNLGAQLYPGMAAMEAASQVAAGRLTHPLPTSAPPDVQQVIAACFTFMPEERPSIDDIVQLLDGASSL